MDLEGFSKLTGADQQEAADFAKKVKQLALRLVPIASAQAAEVTGNKKIDGEVTTNPNILIWAYAMLLKSTVSAAARTMKDTSAAEKKEALRLEIDYVIDYLKDMSEFDNLLE